jgi:hypothetical protein
VPPSSSLHDTKPHTSRGNMVAKKTRPVPGSMARMGSTEPGGAGWPVGRRGVTSSQPAPPSRERAKVLTMPSGGAFGSARAPA